MENRFNLIDEPWIPIADVGRVSLGQLFRNPHYRALGGNPVQKIALMKLLLAIAQAAATPDDETGWQVLGESDLAGSCMAYLNEWHHRFYLYGDQPFLQMPAIARAEIKEEAQGGNEKQQSNEQERALGRCAKGADDTRAADEGEYFAQYHRLAGGTHLVEFPHTHKRSGKKQAAENPAAGDKGERQNPGKEKSCGEALFVG